MQSSDNWDWLLDLLHLSDAAWHWRWHGKLSFENFHWNWFLGSLKIDFQLTPRYDRMMWGHRTPQWCPWCSRSLSCKLLDAEWSLGLESEIFLTWLHLIGCKCAAMANGSIPEYLRIEKEPNQEESVHASCFYIIKICPLKLSSLIFRVVACPSQISSEKRILNLKSKMYFLKNRQLITYRTLKDMNNKVL